MPALVLEPVAADLRAGPETPDCSAGELLATLHWLVSSRNRLYRNRYQFRGAAVRKFAKLWWAKRARKLTVKALGLPEIRKLRMGAFLAVTQGSVEERILQMHHDKRSLADSMLNDQDGTAVLDASALAELLKD